MLKRSSSDALSVLCHGGFSTVYSLEDEGGQKLVLKVLNQHGMLSGGREEEVRILKQLAHLDCVVDVLELEGRNWLHSVDPKRCILMARVAGQDLNEYLNEHPTRSREEELRIGRQMTAAVAAVHAEGIVHRDLKFENMMYDPECGKVTLIDFGLAAVLTPKRTLTRKCGSVNFMPPEMHCRKEYCGYRGDAWSVGVMLFTLFAKNNFPFKQADFTDTRFRNLIYFQREHGLACSPCATLLHGMGADVHTFSQTIRFAVDGLLRISPTDRKTVREAHAALMAAAA